MPPLLVSIVLPVFNSEKYITECLESIVSQTYQNWELLIIDDGSTDNSDKIISACILNVKNPVQYIKLSHHGLPYCLNYAITKANGKYIARIDADDVMLPTRLEKQVLYLEKHASIDILGTNAYEINEKGEIFSIIIKPQDHVNIKAAFSYDCPILHPSVMMRKEIFKQYHYNEIYPSPEDYELWVRLINIVKFDNLQEPLIKKRKHIGQATYFKNRKFIYRGIKLAFWYNMQNKNYLYALASIKGLVLLLLPSSITKWLKKVKYQQKLASYQQSISQ